MFDGKTFLPVTGIPIRKIACMMRPLADADPVPFAVAILNAKSFTRSMGLLLDLHHEEHEEHEGHEGHEAESKYFGLRPSWPSWFKLRRVPVSIQPAPPAGYESPTCACPMRRSGSAPR